MACGPQCRCCILGICCPPGSPEQIAALADFLATAAGESAETGDGHYKMAAKLLAEFKIRSD